MLVPRRSLLILIGAGLLPLAVASGLRPALAGPVAAVAALVGVAAAADAWAGRRRGGAEVAFRFPEVVRLAKGREGGVEFVLAHTRPGRPARSLRLGLALPEAVGTANEERDLRLAPGAERTAFTWPLLGLQRGRFPLERLYYRESSPLGLWDVRRSQALDCELRVYPDLRAERRRAAAVFLSRQGLGTHAQHQVGRGRDFEKLRDYVAGDSIEDISWKATARRQKPVSKVFQVERTQEIYVLLDASRLSGRPVEGDTPSDVSGPAAVAAPTILERYVSTALLLCQAAERQGDLFGLGTFAAGMRTFLRAKNGPAHFDACREAIYALEPAAESPDFDEWTTFLRLRLRRRALLVVLTALDDALQAEALTRAVERVARQHVVIVGGLRPAEVAPLFADADGGAAVTGTEDVYRRLGGHLHWQRLRERELLLRRAGARVALLDPERMTEQLVAQYLNVKRRQIL